MKLGGGLERSAVHSLQGLRGKSMGTGFNISLTFDMNIGFAPTVVLSK